MQGCAYEILYSVPTVPTFAVRENVSLGIRGAPEVPALCRETQSLGQQMLNAPVGINGLYNGHTHACANAKLRQANATDNEKCIASVMQVEYISEDECAIFTAQSL